jgi:hypothetical protein
MSNLTPSVQSGNEIPKAVFPVIKNPVAQNKPIPYTVDPYQAPFDSMLAKDKQTLFDQHSDPEIKKLMKSMGGPDNFINHFRITPAEFYNVYPEMANKKGMPA